MTHGPEPGTILNESGVPTPPRQAATVVVLRGGADRLEVLMVQRTPKARFMGGAWVFPGGAVDAREGEGDAAHRAAAVRELAEEAGIDLDGPQGSVLAQPQRHERGEHLTVVGADRRDPAAAAGRRVHGVEIATHRIRLVAGVGGEEQVAGR